jgi:hypothetical protein
MSEEVETDLDSIINHLLEARNQKPGKVIKLMEQ